MASRRTKSIGIKVTPEEYAQIEALAGEQTICESGTRRAPQSGGSSPSSPICSAGEGSIPGEGSDQEPT